MRTLARSRWGRRLLERSMVSIVLLLLCALPLAQAHPTLAQTSDLALAYHWAPIHYQDTDSSDYDADYLSPVNFDGDWDTKNNWESQDDDVRRLVGKVYYSVVETATHWFIIYAFYHPRDWVDFWNPLDEHENDMEGVLLTVRKDGTAYGQLEAMVTVSHSDFYSFTPAGSPFQNGQENIDGTLIMQAYEGSGHPTTFQEAKGHGIKAWNGTLFGDGVIYYPSLTSAEVPASGNDRDVKYQLVDIFEAGGLWDHRADPLTFASWGTFRGDNGVDNAANAPWGWDDGDDSPGRGELATDPAKLITAYFSNLGNFSRTYLRNLYRS